MISIPRAHFLAQYMSVSKCFQTVPNRIAFKLYRTKLKSRVSEFEEIVSWQESRAERVGARTDEDRRRATVSWPIFAEWFWRGDIPDPPRVGGTKAPMGGTKAPMGDSAEQIYFKKQQDYLAAWKAFRKIAKKPPRVAIKVKVPPDDVRENGLEVIFQDGASRYIQFEAKLHAGAVITVEPPSRKEAPVAYECRARSVEVFKRIDPLETHHTSYGGKATVLARRATDRFLLYARSFYAKLFCNQVIGQAA